MVSGSSGIYRIPNLQVGIYELKAELEGFEPKVVSNLDLAAGEVKMVDIRLQVATIREIVTVVDASPKDSMEATEARESSARDVGEALTRTPGVWKVRKGGIANDIVLRGFKGEDLNVLIDGQRIYGACPNHMDPSAFHVDFAEVGRVEVGKGPFDVKNQGSLGGVVNSYRIQNGTEFYVGVGHTVRVPDPRERHFALRRMGTDWVGNPAVKPIRNTGIDAGFSLRRQNLALETSLYMDRIGDFITIRPQAKINLVPGIMNSSARTYQNVDARIYGGEFQVSYLVTHRVFLSSDLSYVRGTEEIAPERGILSPNLAEMPPMRSRTSMRYDTGRLSAEIEGVFAGAQRKVDTSLGEQSTPGYGIANLRASMNFKRFALRLGLNNMLNRKYYERLSYQRDPFRSGVRVFEPGRNLYANLSYRF